jgi:hypothetical protein
VYPLLVLYRLYDEEPDRDMLAECRRPQDGRDARTLPHMALRGQFVIRSGLDVTNPIFEQVLKLDKKLRRKPKK